MKQLTLLAITAIMVACQSVPTWSEEFEGNTFDTTVWSKIQRGTSEWNKNMATDDSLFRVENGYLVLRGVMTPDSSIHTAGLETHGKKSFGLGRYEIRAKLPQAHGAWPAIWMIPENKGHYAEIDICEKLNFDDSAYQTVHTEFNLPDGDPYQRKYAKGAINPEGFNVYCAEVHKDSICFFINDIHTFTYRRMTEGPEGQIIPTEKQWSFERDWHIKVDMQIGAPWPGEPKLEELPIEMFVDWVRFYAYDE